METQTNQKLEQGSHCGPKPQPSDVTRRRDDSVVGPGLCTCEGPKTVIHSARGRSGIDHSVEKMPD
jgi:hypothetical protein